MRPERAIELAPSILAADFSRLGEQILAVSDLSGRLHVDVMDGHFVPNLSMGPAVVASIRPLVTIPVEVHLMVSHPENFIGPFTRAGADRIIFHIEVTPDPEALAESIQAAGAAAGVALNPATPFDTVVPILGAVDLVTVMTVDPGFGGQDFLWNVLEKVEVAAGVDSRIDIEVDGGVDSRSAPKAREAGANVFVAGTAIFGSQDPAQAASDILGSLGLGQIP